MQNVFLKLWQNKESLTVVDNLNAYIFSVAGNQFILSIYHVYGDVRLVAAPPMVLGKYGGDDDNWRWPRHTADFALLRIYVNENKESSNYQKNNVPLSDNVYLKISDKGVKDNDFVMTMGFPGHTKFYIPSFAVSYTQNEELPTEMQILDTKIKIINDALHKTPGDRYSYTARLSSLNNSYLRYKGELSGLKDTRLATSKEEEEAELTQWIKQDPARLARYGDIMRIQKEIYDKMIPLKKAELYFQQTALNGAEIIPFAGKFEKLVQMFHRRKVNMKAVESEVARLRPLAKQFYDNWDEEVNKKMYANLLGLYLTGIDKSFITRPMMEAVQQYKGNLNDYADDAFKKSILTHPDSLYHFLNHADSTSVAIFTTDPIYRMALGYYNMYVNVVNRHLSNLKSEQSKYYNIYMKAVMEKNKGKMLMPDANDTERLTYGKVASYLSEGQHQTSTADYMGMLKKSGLHQGNADYYIPKKMQDLLTKKDFGQYVKGDLPMCFINTCHTTSGNSGSAILDAQGRLVGINFDRIAEGIVSDYRYMSDRSRSIGVDIRYVLFLLDKYAPTKYVLKEMNITKK